MARLVLLRIYFVKIILFVGLTNPPETKTYKVYEAVPTTNKESVGKCNPLKSLGLGTIHKRCLLRGGGRGVPQKEMKSDTGRDPVFSRGDIVFEK